MDSIPDILRNRVHTHRRVTHPNKGTRHRVIHPNKGTHHRGTHPSKGTHPKDIHKLDIQVTLVLPIKAMDHMVAWAWVEC